MSAANKQNILIVGATGQVGGAVLRSLHSSKKTPKSFNLVAIGRTQAKLDALAEELPGIETRVFSYGDEKTYATALSGAHTVFWNLPNVPVTAAQSKAFVAAVKDNAPDGVAPFIVHVEVFEAPAFIDLLAEHNCPLAEPHVDAAKAVRESGLPWSFVTPGWFFQNFTTFDIEFIKHGIIANGSGDAALPYIDVRDIGDAARAIILDGPEPHNERIYTISGGEWLTYSQAAAIIGKAADREIKYIPSNEPLREPLSAIPLDGETTLFDAVATLHNFTKDASAQLLAIDVGVFPSLTGQHYRSFRRFVRENVELFKQTA